MAASDRNATPNKVTAAARAADDPAAVRRVLIVAADRALFGLLQEWLADCGFAAVEEREAANADRFDLAIVDVPFPRRGGAQLVSRITHGYPGVPILALSSCFFSDIECQGEVARTVGVKVALPKPVARDRLMCAVNTLLTK